MTPASTPPDLDTLPTLALLTRMNEEDQRVAAAVQAELPALAAAVDAIADRLRRGGRLIYVGAGTSGRLAVLDAAECPPTFGTAPDQVVAVLAGGAAALTTAVENAEDDALGGAQALRDLGVSAADAVVGVAASGRTPFTCGALDAAWQCGALTISVAGQAPVPLAEAAAIAITLRVGPEVIEGSTRLKAGTAQKMVLNLLSTAVMIRLGKTYRHWMVDVQPTNAKLRARARRIVAEATGLPPDAAAALLAACQGEIKTAITAALAGVSPETARARLQAAGGSVREALQP